MLSRDILSSVTESEKKTGQILVRLPPADKRRFEQLAKDDGRPAGQLARKIILEWMAAQARASRPGPEQASPGDHSRRQSGRGR